MLRILIAFLLVSPVLSHSQAQPVTISFETNSEGMIKIPVAFAGVETRAFLDTGAGLDIVAPSVFKKMQGRPAGFLAGFRMSGERMDIALYTIDSVRIGPFEKKNVTIGVLDVLDKIGIQAMVGMTDLREQPFTIDFVHKRLTFEAAKSLRERSLQGTTVLLRMDDVRGVSLDLFAEFSFANASGWCEMDTGDPGTAVNTRLMEPLGIDQEGNTVEKVVTKNISGLERVRYKATVPALTFKGVPSSARKDAPVAFSDIIFDCVVGVDFYRDKVLTFDLAHRRLIVGQPD